MKGLYAKKSTGYWYYQPPTEKGQPRPKAIALGTKCELEAVNKVGQFIMGTAIMRAETRETLRDILPKYYSEKAEDSKRTRMARKQILDSFQDLMGNPRLKDVDEELIREWRKKLATTGGSLRSTKPCAPSSITGYLIILKAFLSWAHQKGLIRSNPAKSFKRQTTVKVTRKQNFLTIKQRDALLAKPCADYIGLILHLGFYQGLRHSEMLACNPSWFWINEDWSAGSMTVQDTEITFQDGSPGWWKPKGREARTIPLHPKVLSFLKSYGMRHPYLLAPDRPLWPNDDKTSLRFDPKRALKNHGKKCGINNLGYHILRHSFGTHLSMAGKSINEIAALIGDTLKVTEDHYVGFSPSHAGALDCL